MKIVISAGHGKYVSGAAGFLDEFEETSRVTLKVAEILSDHCTVYSFIDEVSRTQQENLRRIVDFHNSKERDLDVSIHFNCYEETSSPMGTECYYVTQEELSEKVASAISHASGLKNRGAKENGDLYFLNNTEEPAILVEVCFVDSRADADLYAEHFDDICVAIAQAISGETAPVPPPEPSGRFHVKGKASTFGGPEDAGVATDEGLAFITKMEQAPQLFLPFQPVGTTGLARRLNPCVHYLACRWDYSQTTKAKLLKHPALVRAIKTGITLKAFPADWGPHEDTGRVADLSPTLMEDLGISTDDEVEVTFPEETSTRKHIL